MLTEFVSFLKEYKVITLAVAFVMGTAATALVNALVSDIFMPLVAPLMPAGDWQAAVLHLGPIALAYGVFLAALLNFVILAFIVFIIVRKLFNITEEKK